MDYAHANAPYQMRKIQDGRSNMVRSGENAGNQWKSMGIATNHLSMYRLVGLIKLRCLCQSVLGYSMIQPQYDLEIHLMRPPRRGFSELFS